MDVLIHVFLTLVLDENVNFMTHPIYFQGRSAKHPLNWRLGGAHSQSGHFGEEKNLVLLLAVHPYATSL
jgi:hypothetical protein